MGQAPRAKSLQSCLSLCDPVDCSPPGSSVRGMLQAGTLEGVASPPPGKGYLRKPGSAVFSCRESKLRSVICWSKRGHSRVRNPRKKQSGQAEWGQSGDEAHA